MTSPRGRGQRPLWLQRELTQTSLDVLYWPVTGCSPSLLPSGSARKHPARVKGGAWGSSRLTLAQKWWQPTGVSVNSAKLQKELFLQLTLGGLVL